MVVYRRVNDENKIKIDESSPERCLKDLSVLSHVRKDNETFLKEMECFERSKNVFANSIKMRKQQCEKAFPLHSAKAKKEEKYRWVPTHWLRSYVKYVVHTYTYIHTHTHTS